MKKEIRVSIPVLFRLKENLELQLKLVNKLIKRWEEDIHKDSFDKFIKEKNKKGLIR